ncbi:MAG: T9SS type A sorting domain-containing protein [Flavobacteriales bacterium]|nr:T9SS type A sorting domain-containing protein [Flavobacteriales bacterium]
MLRTNDGGLLLFGGYWSCEVTKLDPAYDIEWVFDDAGLTHAQPTGGFLTTDGLWLCGTILSGPSSIPNFHGPGDGYVMKLTHNYDLVRGQAFVDLDSDGMMGPSEDPLVHHLFRIAGTDRMDLSGSGGSFELSVLQPGGCLTEPAPFAHFTAVPASHASFFTTFGEVDSSAVFAVQPDGVVNDLHVELIPIGPFRPGFWSQYAVHCMNTGTTALQATLVLHPDQHLDFVGSSPAPDVVTDSLIWDLGNIDPLEQRMFWVTFEVATSAPVGSQALSELIAYPILGDALPTDNQDTGPVVYTSSCDPNLVRVDRAVVGPDEIGGPLELEYTIEFQNTGNDTAFTVLIENPWPTNCRISTFQFVAASHPVSITMDGNQHRTWFRFDHILLPDSTTDEGASHGFVRYRIKPEDDLVLGDVMTNQAGIFFDYNSVVMTNTATTIVGTNTGVPASALPPCSVHPNPTTGHVTVSVGQRDPEALVRVLDALGRPVLNAPMPDLQLDLVLSKLPPGSYHVIRMTGRGQSSTHVILQ